MSPAWSTRVPPISTQVDYYMILEGTAKNCGGGKTPWDTWISCEERKEGRCWEADPFVVDSGRSTSLVLEAGKYESVAYDARDPSSIAFFTAEDRAAGPLTRFVPDDPSPGGIRGPGDHAYLVLDATQGTFAWTGDRDAAAASAEETYPNAEGVDVRNGVLSLTSKARRMLLVLDLDAETYAEYSTESGHFNNEPDQITRLGDVLYFAEDGGDDCGVHARDAATGNFYTVLEGPAYDTETSGIAFSPDAKHFYVSFQSAGLVVDVTRDDGRPFDDAALDVVYSRHGA